MGCSCVTQRRPDELRPFSNLEAPRAETNGSTSTADAPREEKRHRRAASKDRSEITRESRDQSPAPVVDATQNEASGSSTAPSLTSSQHERLHGTYGNGAQGRRDPERDRRRAEKEKSADRQSPSQPGRKGSSRQLKRRASLKNGNADHAHGPKEDNTRVLAWLDGIPDVDPLDLTPPCSPPGSPRSTEGSASLPSAPSSSFNRGQPQAATESERERSAQQSTPSGGSLAPPGDMSATPRRRASTLSAHEREKARAEREKETRLKRRESSTNMAAFTGETSCLMRARSKDSFYTSRSSEWMYDLTNLKKEFDRRKQTPAAGASSPRQMPGSPTREVGEGDAPDSPSPPPPDPTT
eukprot:TRINITY_DN35680_c0_g1_i1.p1 TRINITY_DN35680_c0_g1~~TRINITY_DN35680_c0_g1_i1.p1  ORF type:complete len:354 (+),score=57.12 TRINITY_DN35680_c0_g1_i1:115-1176(+)